MIGNFVAREWMANVSLRIVVTGRKEDTEDWIERTMSLDVESGRWWGENT